jgi:hypothetical protein
MHFSSSAHVRGILSCLFFSITIDVVFAIRAALSSVCFVFFSFWKYDAPIFALLSMLNERRRAKVGQYKGVYSFASVHFQENTATTLVVVRNEDN